MKHVFSLFSCLLKIKCISTVHLSVNRCKSAITLISYPILTGVCMLVDGCLNIEKPYTKHKVNELLNPFSIIFILKRRFQWRLFLP